MSALTAEQRVALAPLTPKRRTFVLAYVGEHAGNATAAARTARYAKPAEEGCRLLRNARVRAAVEALQAPVERAAIAGREERLEILSQIARGQIEDASNNPLGNRIKASELLAKMSGDLVEKREVKHEGGTPIVFGVLAVAQTWARGEGPKEGEKR